MRIYTTFCTVTQESAEQGDFAESGWIDREGEDLESVEAAIDFLESAGVTEASSSWFHAGVWYSTEPDTDIHSGDSEQHSFHLYGFSEAEQEQIYTALSVK